MKYLRNYKLYESNNEDVISDILEIMSEIIDTHSNVVFKSPKGDMSYDDYLKNNYNKFEPIYKAGNKIKSKFTINFNKITNYAKLAWLVNNMESAVGRLKNNGWLLSDLKIETTYFDEKNNISLYNLDYHFSKPTETLNSDELPKESEIVQVFNKNVLNLKTEEYNITVYDNYVDIGFDAISYDGEIPSNVESYFQKVADILGFTEFEYNKKDPWGIRFWFN